MKVQISGYQECMRCSSSRTQDAVKLFKKRGKLFDIEDVGGRYMLKIVSLNKQSSAFLAEGSGEV